MIAYALRLTALFSISIVFCADFYARPGDSPRAGRVLTIQGYISALEESSSVLAGINRAAIHNLRTELPTEWIIQSGGHESRVKTDWLATALAEAETGPPGDKIAVQQAKQRLALLREAAEGFSKPSPEALAAGQSRAQLDQILSAREFEGLHGPSWFDTLKARIYNWIGKHLQKILGRFSLSSTASNIIVWILISVAALLLAYATVKGLLRTAPQSQIDLRGASAGGWGWRDWLRSARAAAERGDHREAIHAAYWAGIARLEETHLLPEDRSRTPRESLRLVKRDSAVFLPLTRLTSRFELIWYGLHPATPGDWSDVVQQLEELGCLRPSTPAIAGS